MKWQLLLKWELTTSLRRVWVSSSCAPVWGPPPGRSARPLAASGRLPESANQAVIYRKKIRLQMSSFNKNYQKIWNWILKFVGDVLDVNSLHGVLRTSWWKWRRKKNLSLRLSKQLPDRNKQMNSIVLKTKKKNSLVDMPEMCPLSWWLSPKISSSKIAKMLY